MPRGRVARGRARARPAGTVESGATCVRPASSTDATRRPPPRAARRTHKPPLAYVGQSGLPRRRTPPTAREGAARRTAPRAPAAAARSRRVRRRAAGRAAATPRRARRGAARGATAAAVASERRARRRPPGGGSARPRAAPRARASVARGAPSFRARGARARAAFSATRPCARPRAAHRGRRRGRRSPWRSPAALAETCARRAPATGRRRDGLPEGESASRPWAAQFRPPACRSAARDGRGARTRARWYRNGVPSASRARRALARARATPRCPTRFAPVNGSRRRRLVPRSRRPLVAGDARFAATGPLRHRGPRAPGAGARVGEPLSVRLHLGLRNNAFPRMGAARSAAWRRRLWAGAVAKIAVRRWRPRSRRALCGREPLKRGQAYRPHPALRLLICTHGRAAARRLGRGPCRPCVWRWSRRARDVHEACRAWRDRRLSPPPVGFPARLGGFRRETWRAPTIEEFSPATVEVAASSRARRRRTCLARARAPARVGAASRPARGERRDGASKESGRQGRATCSAARLFDVVVRARRR